MKYIAIDIEAIGLKPYNGTVWMLSVTENKKTTLYENCNGLTRKDLPKELIAKLEDPTYCKIIHNSEYDGPYIGLNLGCRIRNIWDTYLCEIVIQGMRVPRGSRDENLKLKYSAGLEYVLQRYGFPKPDKSIRNTFVNREKGIPFTKQEKEYAKNDTKYLPAIQKAQEYLLTRDNLLEVALLENKVAERIIAMRMQGIGFDKNIWVKIAEENTNEFKKRTAKLPKDVENWNSEKQVKKYFMDLGILIESYEDLDKVYKATKNSTLGNFISARALHKSVTSYGLNWLEEGFIDSDDRIRCNVDQIINTGRNSMSNPNLQQLPAEGKHRSAFVPKKGYSFVIGDFSGQEIGIMAAMSEEDLWIEAMLRGEDIHALTASIINPGQWQASASKGCTFPKKCKCPGHLDMRKPAKINNFMLAYGGGPMKFAESVGVDMLAAKVYVSAHKRVIPRLTRCLEKNAREALDTGVSYSADPYRRRRVLRGQESWQIANQGKNNPIQSAGANMLKLAMISIPENLPIVLVIHDEIILEVPTKNAKSAAKVLKNVMEQAADYITGIKGLIKVEPRIAQNLMKDE